MSTSPVCMTSASLVSVAIPSRSACPAIESN